MTSLAILLLAIASIIDTVAILILQEKVRKQHWEIKYLERHDHTHGTVTIVGGQQNDND